MNNKPLPYQVTKPHLILSCLFGLLIATISVHFFILGSIFTEPGKLFFVDVPGRTGGATYYLDPSEFNAISLTAVAITAVAVIVAGVLVSRKKLLLPAALATLMLTTVIAIYSAIMVGNAFHDLWGGVWSFVGALLAFGVVSAFELPLLISIIKSRTSNTPK